MRYLLRSSRSLVAAARLPGGRLVGWAVVLLRKHRRHRTARLYSLAVDPDFRGRGLGRRLVAHVLERLVAKGVQRVFLEVAEENVEAQRLYERLGFVAVAVLPNYYGEGRHGRRLLRTGPAQGGTVPLLPQPLGFS